MKTLRPLLLSLAAALALVPAAFAAQLGDAAAPLHIANWAKGKPVDLAVLKSNQVAVVEFWATWYAPCRTSIPHLTELQKKFKDVVFIGVSDEDADTVKKFVDKMGDKMDYRVAVDKDGQTGEAYMKAYGQNGIPTAFVVDKQGRIVWLGHPMGDLEKVLDQLLAGKYDLNKARKLGELQSKEEQYVELAGEGADESQLEKLAVEIAAMEKGIGDIGPDRKFDPAQVRKIVGFRKAMAEYQEALAAGKAPAELDRIATTLQAVAPPGFNLDEFRGDMAARRLFNDYYQAATKGTDKEELAALTKKIGEAKIDQCPHAQRPGLGHFDRRELQDAGPCPGTQTGQGRRGRLRREGTGGAGYLRPGAIRLRQDSRCRHLAEKGRRPHQGRRYAQGTGSHAEEIRGQGEVSW